MKHTRPEINITPLGTQYTNKLMQRILVMPDDTIRITDLEGKDHVLDGYIGECMAFYANHMIQLLKEHNK